MKWLMALLMTLLVSCSTVQSRDSSLDVSSAGRFMDSVSDNAVEAYQSGNMLILYAYNDDAVDSEAFFDWQSYLNDFVANADVNAFAERIDPSGSNLMTTLSSSEFTVFLKQGFPTYYYPDFIVEPQVYTAVETVYQEKGLSVENKAFLPEILDAKGRKQ